MGFGDVLGGITSFFGDAFGGEPLRQEATQAWRNLHPDDINTLLRQYQSGSNAYDQVQGDPFYDQAAKGAVSDLIQRGRSFGQDPQMQATLREAGNNMRSRNQMAQGAVGNQFLQSGGGGGGGAELMNKLMAQQGSYEQAGNFGAQAAGQSQARATENTKAGMAGAYEGSKQDWAAKAAKAEAANRIGMFNANARRGGYQDVWNQNLGKAQGLSGQLMNAQQYPGRTYGAAGQAAGGLFEYGMGGFGKGG